MTPAELALGYSVFTLLIVAAGLIAAKRLQGRCSRAVRSEPRTRPGG